MEFGFGDTTPEAKELAAPGKIWMLGRKPWRIDILTSIDGVTFDAAWRGRVRAAFGTSTLPVIGLKELLRNKRASGRPKDLADAARLEELSKDRRPKANRKKTRTVKRRRK